MSKVRRIRLALLAGGAIFVVVCGNPTLEVSGLYQIGTPWPTPDIKVCWETGLDARFGTGNPTAASSVANFATFSAWAQDAVEDSWGRVANLRFIGWNDCSSRNDKDLAGWVTIVWGSIDNTTNGIRTDTWTRMGLILPADTSEGKSE